MVKGRHGKKLKFGKKSFHQKSRRKDVKQDVQSVIARYGVFVKEDSSNLTLFEDFPLSPATKNGLAKNNFVTPTEIQRQTIQYALTGADIVGAAKTGSGKTLAFIIPLLECLWRQNWSRVDGLGALVITPTRELAFQTFNVLNKVGAHHNFSAALLIGGTDVNFEKRHISGVNIVICAPGRLLQHMDESSDFMCDHLQMLVIDEADRILDAGFKPQMNAILENLPKDRQTLLFSATQTKDLNDLICLALKNPLYISVHENAPQVTPESLEQSYLVCTDEEKINFLWSFLVNHHRKKTLIFVTCCKQARFLTEAFCHLRPGLSLMGLWGTMNQNKRFEVFKRFNNKMSGAAMIATDVASRGLDFSRVDMVLQLDCPAEIEDYIHRVGRTARMDARGEAILVLTPSQEGAMVKSMQAKNIPINKISVDQRLLRDISKRLQSINAQYSNMKQFAQKSFVAYVRAIYLMRNKNVFDVDSIDCAALASAYGLANAPRIRFLNRAARKKPQAGVQKSREKNVEELMEMMLHPVAEGISKESPVDDEDDFLVGKKQDSVQAGGNDVSRKLAVYDNENDDMEVANSSGSDDDLLHVTRRNVFNVISSEVTIDLDESPPNKKPRKVITRQALARKIIKKGVRLNVKKVFTEEGDDTMETDKLNVQESSEATGLNINDAKREMREIDRFDKTAYRNRLKKLRITKKEKMKKRKASQEQGGAVLDLGDGEEADEEPDLSWLPDPSKPKKYDAAWNEIVDERVADESPSDDSVVMAKRKSKKHSGKSERRIIENFEAKALSLLKTS